MRTYTQLTQEQRYQIYALKKMGHHQTEIANFVGVDKSTISRELQRNQGQSDYRPKQAHNLALSRRKQGQCRIPTKTGTKINWRMDAEFKGVMCLLEPFVRSNLIKQREVSLDVLGNYLVENSSQLSLHE